MSVIYRLFSAIDRVKPTKIAEAHCDIPCGIYDPYHAQLAAHTIIRMVNLIDDLKISSMDAPIEERKRFINQISRYTATKEEHAELVKREVRIIWGDYFKPEHLQQYPELHELSWKIMKLASKARQEVNMDAAQELLHNVQKFAEIFWKTKGMDTARVKAPSPLGGEIVVQK